MNLLNRLSLNAEERLAFERMKSSPATVLQIGEGNFLRGFFDWMIHECRKAGRFDGSVAVVQPRPSGRDNIARLAAQDGLYQLVIRGMENGEAVSRREIIPVFSAVFDPYAEWERLKELAVSPELKIVVSNTTEAGLAYRPEPLTEGPILSFPGKMAYLLYLRWLAFDGAPDRGLIFLPCELLERNGDALRGAVLQFAEDWGFPASFRNWVAEHNRFLNTLVDRIVTGYPEQSQAEAWFAEWGFRDDLLCTAEPYHLWAIEAEPELESLLPFRASGLNVHWTDNLEPFRERKVRLLNGAHTWMAPLGLIHGVRHVGEMLRHPEFGPRLRQAVFAEILPTLPYSAEVLTEYAESVFERFANPYILHRLSDIAMNSLSKFRVRLLPSLAHYGDRGQPIPEQLCLGLAGLLRCYKVRRREGDGFAGIALAGSEFPVRDDEALLETLADLWQAAETGGWTREDTAGALLAEPALWGRSLSGWNGLAAAIARQWAKWEGEENR